MRRPANQPPAGKAATRTARAARSPPTAGSGPSRSSSEVSPLTGAVGCRRRALIGPIRSIDLGAGRDDIVRRCALIRLLIDSLDAFGRGDPHRNRSPKCQQFREQSRRRRASRGTGFMTKPCKYRGSEHLHTRSNGQDQDFKTAALGHYASPPGARKPGRDDRPGACAHRTTSFLSRTLSCRVRFDRGPPRGVRRQDDKRVPSQTAKSVARATTGRLGIHRLGP